MRPGLDGEALDELLGVGLDAPAVQPAAGREVIDVLHDQVERHRQVKHEAGVAVLRDAADAGRHDRPRVGPGQLRAFDADAARHHAAHAAEHLGQLALAVATDTGHAHDLAGVDIQADVVQGRQAVIAARGHATDLQPCLAVVPQRLLAVDTEGGPPDHHARQLPLVGVTRRGADHAALAHHRDAVADGADLAQLVADEDDGEAIGDEPPQRLEERRDLLRHEHGGGLVEDQHAAVARERLDDLDTLLLTDREVLHQRVGPDGDAEPVGRRLDRATRADQVEPGAPGATEDDVLGDGHRLHQAEVLGDHADAGRDGVARGVDGDGPAVDVDGAAVGAGEPVEDAHQRRLAGAVLAQQGMDLAPLQSEVHGVVGDEVAEALADATQLGGQVALAAGSGHACVAWEADYSGMTDPAGVASLMSTRNRPLTISASLAMTVSSSSAGTRASLIGAKAAPPLPTMLKSLRSWAV